eukprot:CAMPEP_0202902926 /NCGR_PEP_ID=MMETSP1392-20130828/18852_1 /ASSEMBLY_ACC=CAM_ASM_000868 /TAXON_ID=225041 /ORGANISM="Chlamydomonas chlamydogama, Strain SAG 11-48b" /LENGTH=395 /DNA_ID=CAMNT_0049589789 /DNA_START=35 /DNA_END=1222 /DNA_ORIENTATION=+
MATLWGMLGLIVCLLLSCASTVLAEAKEDEFIQLQYSQGVDKSPAWNILPWGPPTDWSTVSRTLKCIQSMQAHVSRIQYTCPPQGQRQFPPCSYRIAVVRMVAGDYVKNVRYTFNKHTTSLTDKYCKRWGSCEQFLVTNPNHSHVEDAANRHLSWHKVWVVREVMKNHTEGPYKDKFTHYMWLDGDASFIDHSIDLRFVLSMAGDATFMNSQDVWNTPGPGNSNLGVWVMRNNDKARQMLDEWWDSPNKNKEVADHKMNHPWEQFAWNTYMYPRWEKDVHRYPDCWFMGYPWNLLSTPFVAHLCGIPMDSILAQRGRYFKFWDDNVWTGDRRRLMSAAWHMAKWGLEDASAATRRALTALSSQALPSQQQMQEEGHASSQEEQRGASPRRTLIRV